MTGNRTERARRYLGTVAPSGRIEELVEAAPESIGTGGTSELERPLLEKLAMGQPLAPREEFALEAIIIPDKRPAIDIVDGTYTAAHADWLHLNDPATLARLEAAFPSIGRVEVPGHPTAPYGGTAFVVGDGLLMTNRHVAEIFSLGLGAGGLSFIPGRGAAVDFHRERGDTAHAPITASRLVMIHPFWDMALFEIDGLPAGHKPLTLDITDPEDFVGRDIAVVGYPAFDVRNPHDVQQSVFGGTYGIKRLQPGKMRGRAKVTSYDRLVSAPTHDSSTLGGNSGSCVIDIASGRVVALHFGGRYLEANYAVASGDLALDGRVIDAGVRFSSVPEPGPAPWDSAWREIGTPELGSAGPERLSATTVKNRVDGPGKEMGELMIPLEITVRLGHGQTRVSITGRTGEDASGGIDQDYGNRRGFDPRFLGPEIRMPLPRAPERISRALDGEALLHYHHFSVFMHRDRRLAMMTAANVDIAGGTNRHGTALGGGHSWMRDPRLDPAAQLPESAFRADPAPFDPVQLVKSRDIAWESAGTEARYAITDCYHVTNVAPKPRSARRRQEGWDDIEVAVAARNDGTRLSVFTGPVLAPDDPEIDLTDAGPLQIPRRYWKLVVARKGGSLRAYGVVLRQDFLGVSDHFDLADTSVCFLQPLAAIEALAGFEFDPALHRACTFGTDEATALATAAGIGTSDPTRPDPAASGDQAAHDALADIDEILELWREDQSADGDRDPARFVLELDTPVPDAALEAQLSDALGLDLAVGPLFDGDDEGDGDLDRYRLVEIPGIGDADRADLFDVARALRALTDAVAVEPDLGTRYFDADPLAPPEGTAEGGNIAFWCWAGDDRRPADADWAIKQTRAARCMGQIRGRGPALARRGQRDLSARHRRGPQPPRSSARPSPTIPARRISWNPAHRRWTR